MLYGARSLRGHTLHAIDGEIGHVRDLYFDDDAWRVRWLVVDTGTWLAQRRVLVSTYAAGPVEPASRSIAVKITRQMVEDSPDVDFDMPVSRQHEVEVFTRYGWPYSWIGAGVLVGPTEPDLGAAAAALGPTVPVPVTTRAGDLHLRSSRHVAGFFGYGVHGTDGDLGHVADVVVDDEGWSVPYLAVDTSSLGIGRKVLVPTKGVGLVSWEDARVCVGQSRAMLAQAEPWDPHHHGPARKAS